MENEEAKIVGACPSPYGYAVFVKCPSKTFVIYMDKSGGGAVDKAMNQTKSQRPSRVIFIRLRRARLQSCRRVDIPYVGGDILRAHEAGDG